MRASHALLECKHKIADVFNDFFENWAQNNEKNVLKFFKSQFFLTNLGALSTNLGSVSAGTAVSTDFLNFFSKIGKARNYAHTPQDFLIDGIDNLHEQPVELATKSDVKGKAFSQRRGSQQINEAMNSAKSGYPTSLDNIN